MSKFLTRQKEVDAFRWTGDHDQTEDPQWIIDAITAGTVKLRNRGTADIIMEIQTPGGVFVAHRGNWIVLHPDGEIYPYTEEVFMTEYSPDERNAMDGLRAMMAGSRVARKGWADQGAWLEIQRPDAHSKMTKPYIYLTDGEGGRVPYTPTMVDILTADWFVLEEAAAEPEPALPDDGTRPEPPTPLAAE